MTDVLVTIDTELSAALHQSNLSVRANIENSIHGFVKAGHFGVGWQMDQLEEHGLKGVFFVDPLPALVYGEDVVADMVGPILERGHEVQLHIHTEWLAWAKTPLVGDRRGQNIGDFDLADQTTLLQCARDLLERANVPRPIAFRAGNYGADDRTLTALSDLGIVWDSSFNAPYLDDGCRIGLTPSDRMPVWRNGVVELPVSGIFDRSGHIRPAQVCALSRWEMTDALRHAAHHRQPAFVIVSHSFEMLSRDRRRPNRAVMARFTAMCREIARNPDLRSAGFGDLDTAIAAPSSPATASPAPPSSASSSSAPSFPASSYSAAPRLAPSLPRTVGRVIEQAAAAVRYERQWTISR